MAAQVAVSSATFHCPLLPLDSLFLRLYHRILCHPVHRKIPEKAVRFQRGRPALVMAGGFLQLPGARNRPVSPLQPGIGPGLPGGPGHTVSGKAIQGTCAGKMVAAGHSALHRYRDIHGRKLGRGADLHTRYFRRHRRPVYREVPGRHVQAGGGNEPLVVTGRSVCNPDAGRVPAVPALG